MLPSLFQENRAVAWVCEWVKGYPGWSVGNSTKDFSWPSELTLWAQGTVVTFGLSCDWMHFCSVAAGVYNTHSSSISGHLGKCAAWPRKIRS